MTNHPYISEILHGLTSSGLDYCIQNGYEDMPESFPTDIDIFYRNATEKDLDGIVMNITRNCGLLVMQKVAMGYYHFVYWFNT
jgi:NADPH-dependent curcumin reductase CurA